MSWLSGYGYRAKITITGSSDASQTYYPTEIVINETVGANNGNIIYLNGHDLSWPNDIRFTTSDGSSPLDFWRESNTASTGNWWVEVDSIPQSPSTVDIYCYYGKSSDTDASSGDNTFSFFDDFPGAALDTNKWTITGSPTVASSKVTITSGQRIDGKTSVGVDYAVHWYAKMVWAEPAAWEGTVGFRDEFGGAIDNDACYNYMYGAISSIGCVTRSGGAASGSVTPGINEDHVYHIFRILRHSATLCRYIIDNDSNRDVTSGVPTTSLPATATSRASFTGTTEADWVFIRKWTPNEPVDSTNSEEPLVTANMYAGVLLFN